MPSLHDLTPSRTDASAPAASIRVRLVAGASRLAIATIMRRKAASAAMN